jgi:hypothetical protein
MTDPERIEALLDLVDPDRTPDAATGSQLVVLGLAARTPKGACRPTTAGWALMGEQGRAYKVW